MAAPGRFDTHEVTNQSPPFADVDLFGLDRPLQDAVRANGAAAEVKPQPNAVCQVLLHLGKRRGKRKPDKTVNAKKNDNRDKNELPSKLGIHAAA